jgi:hypothetical protein
VLEGPDGPPRPGDARAALFRCLWPALQTAGNQRRLGRPISTRRSATSVPPGAETCLPSASPPSSGAPAWRRRWSSSRGRHAGRGQARPARPLGRGSPRDRHAAGGQGRRAARALHGRRGGGQRGGDADQARRSGGVRSGAVARAPEGGDRQGQGGELRQGSSARDPQKAQEARRHRVLDAISPSCCGTVICETFADVGRTATGRVEAKPRGASPGRPSRRSSSSEAQPLRTHSGARFLPASPIVAAPRLPGRRRRGLDQVRLAGARPVSTRRGRESP